MEPAATYPDKPAPSRWTFTGILIFSYLYPVLLFAVVGLWIRDHTALRYLATVISSLILGGVGLWGMRRDGISLAEVGFRSKNLPQAILLLAASWAVMAGFYFLADGWAGLHLSAAPAQVIQQWLFVGPGEELLYRGYLLNRLLRAFSHLKKAQAYALSIGLSSFFFATMHIPVRLYNGFSLPNLLISLGLIFLIGVLFCSFFLRTRNILYTGLAHGSWNVPLLGTQGDYLQMLVVMAVIEGYLLITGKRRKPVDVPLES